MENPIKKFKKNQKELALKIKGEEGTEYDSYLFRHYHIAYCELRGTSRGDIENPRSGNEPNETLVERYKKEWLVKINAWRSENEKTLCSGD